MGIAHRGFDVAVPHADAHDKAEKDARTLENQQSTELEFLMLQSVTSNTHLAEIDRRMYEAKGNPQRMAELGAQAAAARIQANNLSKTILLAMAPGIVGEMRTVANKWDMADQSIATDAHMRMSLLPIERQAEREGIAQDLAKKRLSLNTSYSHQVIPLMTSADYLRKGLLADSTQTLLPVRLIPRHDLQFRLP